MRKVGRTQYISHQMVELPSGMAFGLRRIGQGVRHLVPMQLTIRQCRQLLAPAYLSHHSTAHQSITSYSVVHFITSPPFA
ncbi:hypothetical protein D3C72_1963960 [compost metagenome]